ncbi:MAG: L-serine ammonia-lyase, iron-sulfur-dependent, subunit alpha [Rectinemataceae bacterium]|nr:L-serine ammonia-lyase, iron-sulfur-dependent, subunit alpha [Spirochaetaceae bacterium]
MVNETTYRAFCAILEEELVPAMGCTEPIAVAFAAAKAREVLGEMPVRAEAYCSANIVKNVKSVRVPNTGGLRGIDVAVIAGVLANAADRELEVLEALQPEDRKLIAPMRDRGFCRVALADGIEGLYIDVRLFAGEGATERSARVVVKDTHTGIHRIEKDGVELYPAGKALPLGRASKVSADRHEYSLLNVPDIVAFAESVKLEDVAPVIRRQILMNQAIAEEGLQGSYGVSVGKTLLSRRDSSDVRVRARARAAAGSDARMAGCSMPVVINSGSGNQGLTVSLPVIEYAKELGAGEDRLIRALVISNLVALEQKEYIGKLSAYCGAVSAAAGAAAGIAWLEGGSIAVIGAVVTNAVATAGGILCDGAKASCASKIATALEAAIMGEELALKEGRSFSDGEGLVGPDVDATIRNVGIIGSQGMRSTDARIIQVMLGNDAG